MYHYAIVLLGLHIVSAAPPLRLEIDCGSQETDNPRSFYRKSPTLPHRVDVDSICSIIHKALPKTVNDGKFILIGETTDQSRATNDLVPIAVPPPRGFLPTQRIKVPNLKVPRLKVSKTIGRPLLAPRVGVPMHFPSLRAKEREDSSAERMERFKKGVQKMLHVVKVLGQIDQYLSERTRSVINVLSKTFNDSTDGY